MLLPIKSFRNPDNFIIHRFFSSWPKDLKDNQNKKKTCNGSIL